MTVSTDRVRDWYDANVELEDHRLDEGRLEYAVTLRVLLQTLQSLKSHSPAISQTAKIADIGCATGRYAIELARHGHQVTIADISANLVGKAKENALKNSVSFEGTYVCDARCITEEQGLHRPEYYDMTLLLGPLYHVLETNEQCKVLLSALTITRPGGFVLAAFVTRNAHLRDVCMRDPERLAREADFYKTYLQDGKYVRGSGPSMHHSSLADIRALLAQLEALTSGFKLRRMVACEGFLGFRTAANLARLPEAAFERWIDLIMNTAEDEATFGASDHLLVVLQKTSST